MHNTLLPDNFLKKSIQSLYNSLFWLRKYNIWYFSGWLLRHSYILMLLGYSTQNLLSCWFHLSHIQRSSVCTKHCTVCILYTHLGTNARLSVRAGFPLTEIYIEITHNCFSGRAFARLLSLLTSLHTQNHQNFNVKPANISLNYTRVKGVNI